MVRELTKSFASLFVSFPAAVALYRSRPGVFRLVGEFLQPIAHADGVADDADDDDDDDDDDDNHHHDDYH
eukprot:4581391-Amphidinium_carterae.1